MNEVVKDKLIKRTHTKASTTRARLKSQMRERKLNYPLSHSAAASVGPDQEDGRQNIISQQSRRRMLSRKERVSRLIRAIIVRISFQDVPFAPLSPRRSVSLSSFHGNRRDAAPPQPRRLSRHPIDPPRRRGGGGQFQPLAAGGRHLPAQRGLPMPQVLFDKSVCAAVCGMASEERNE